MLYVEKVLREEKYKDINEAQTIDLVVSPVLRVYMGWDRENPEQVLREWNGKVVNDRVDFALFKGEDERPYVLMEVKRLRLRLDDKSIKQVLSYAYTEGVRWCILTNGVEWRLYDVYNTSKELGEKEVYRVDLDNGGKIEDLENMGINEDYEKRLKEKKVKEVLSKLGGEGMIDIISSLSGVTDRELIKGLWKGKIEGEDIGSRESWNGVKPKGVVIGEDTKVNLTKWSTLIKEYVTYCVDKGHKDTILSLDKMKYVIKGEETEKLDDLGNGIWLDVDNSTEVKVRIIGELVKVLGIGCRVIV